jgi:hypothetical protein
LGSKGDQPLDHQIGESLLSGYSGSGELDKRRQKERNGLWILGLANKKQGAGVYRKPLQSLRENQPRKSGI